MFPRHPDTADSMKKFFRRVVLYVSLVEHATA